VRREKLWQNEGRGLKRHRSASKIRELCKNQGTARKSKNNGQYITELESSTQQHDRTGSFCCALSSILFLNARKG